MSQLRIRPAGPLLGQEHVPGDKSISHRALILGAIARRASRIERFLPAADCLATLSVVRALGVEVQELSPTTLIVHGRGLHALQEPAGVLDCGRSGTTMRLVAGLLAGQPFLSVLSGEAQLRRRPMRRVVDPLRLMGTTILGRDGGRLPPLAIQGGNLRGIDYTLSVASAQVKSALLLAGLYASGHTVLHVPGPARDHTERMLAAQGASVQTEGNRVQVSPTEFLECLDLVVPGDLSSAAFLAVAALIVPGSEIRLEGVGVNSARIGLLDVLQVMGGNVTLENRHNIGGEPVADLVVRASELCAAEIGGETVVRMIDEFPVLAVAATQAHGETVVRDAAELRVKETDRIATTAAELCRLGAKIGVQRDGFVVHGPTPLTGTAVHSHGDHRLAMALAVAGLIASGETVVQGAECIADSYPGFAAALERIRAVPPKVRTRS